MGEVVDIAIHFLQDIKYIVSSPFLRCLQTAREICTVLHLDGIHICNGIVEELCGECGIHQQPEIPAKDVSQQGINIVELDMSPLPKYPEKTKQGLQRLLLKSLVHYIIASSMFVQQLHNIVTALCP